MGALSFLCLDSDYFAFVKHVVLHFFVWKVIFIIDYYRYIFCNWVNGYICFLSRCSVRRSCRIWWERLIQMSSWMRMLRRSVSGFNCRFKWTLFSHFSISVNINSSGLFGVKLYHLHLAGSCCSLASLTYCHIHHLEILFYLKPGCMKNGVSWNIRDWSSRCGTLLSFTEHDWWSLLRCYYKLQMTS